MRKLAYILTAIVALAAVGCRKGAPQEPARERAEVQFAASPDLTVTYTRADQSMFNGMVGAINAVDGWEFSPEAVSFKELAANATEPQTMNTAPEKITVPVGDYTFVSAAISGAGRLAIEGDNITIEGGKQTANNDVVWASTTAHVVNREGAPFGVELAYDHVFAGVVFEVALGDATTGATSAEEVAREAVLSGVENLGLSKSGMLNIRTGKTTANGNTLGEDESIAWNTPYMVIPTSSEPAQLTVNYRGAEYKGTLPAKTFTAGARLKIGIRLNTASLGFTATIKEWTEVVDDDLILE